MWTQEASEVYAELQEAMSREPLDASEAASFARLQQGAPYKWTWNGNRFIWVATVDGEHRA